MANGQQPALTWLLGDFDSLLPVAPVPHAGVPVPVSTDANGHLARGAVTSVATSADRR
jgi:hypothetical protein